MVLRAQSTIEDYTRAVERETERECLCDRERKGLDLYTMFFFYVRYALLVLLVKIVPKKIS